MQTTAVSSVKSQDIPQISSCTKNCMVEQMAAFKALTGYVEEPGANAYHQPEFYSLSTYLAEFERAKLNTTRKIDTLQLVVVQLILVAVVAAGVFAMVFTSFNPILIVLLTLAFSNIVSMRADRDFTNQLGQRPFYHSPNSLRKLLCFLYVPFYHYKQNVVRTDPSRLKRMQTIFETKFNDAVAFSSSSQAEALLKEFDVRIDRFQAFKPKKHQDIATAALRSVQTAKAECAACIKFFREKGTSTNNNPMPVPVPLPE